MDCIEQNAMRNIVGKLLAGRRFKTKIAPHSDSRQWQTETVIC